MMFAEKFVCEICVLGQNRLQDFAVL